MSDPRTPIHTGGCQCGAVRYALYAEPTRASICHCRMCQKAFGSYFAPLAGVPPGDFAWTHGSQGVFKSSALVERGFCRDCGTPLTFRYLDRDRISVSLGSLDEPERVPPLHQHGLESRMPFLAALIDLPGTRTDEDNPPERMAGLRSLQHPGCD